ncbi:LysR family transcriptional regulator [Oceanospirillum sediminis]|uniref:LysR family transcriptional regulator n=1 Tax=Oceanospirillum sediminis TaxID=2760088 RepID=A0A839IKU5_9GAMM|nr:LysR family transcriptional regulator [Oceanospirillum sediminis]MBB1485344.1 LysR family transcriptional regulator [Oceanospirillum sediminis]
MDKHTAMKVFCRVVEKESFAATGRELGISTAMVSKYVAALEKELGTRLLNRTTRRVSPTDEGQYYYNRCSTLLMEMDELESSVTQQGQEPRGVLRLTAPMDFSVLHLMEPISLFQQQYPLVRIEVDLDDRHRNLIADKFDIAIRIAHLSDSTLVARKITQCRSGLYASPEYLSENGKPETPEDLQQHRFLFYSNLVQDRNYLVLHDKKGQKQRVRIPWTLAVNNGRALCEAAAQGMGIIQQPDFMTTDYLQQGRLQPVLEDYPPIEFNVYAVYQHRQFLPRRIMAFIDFLIEYFRNNQRW